MATIEDVEAEVSEISTVADSTLTLIDRMADQIEAAQNDPAQLAAIVSSLRSKREALAAAVTANTQAEDPPVE